MVGRIRVAVVDDHPLFRDGVSQTFCNSREVDIVATGASYDDAIQIVKQTGPDILLLDIQMPGGGIEAARSICGMACPTKVVMLTASENEEHVAAALEAGAAAYLLKGISGSDLLLTLKTVLTGQVYVTP